MWPGAVWGSGKQVFQRAGQKKCVHNAATGTPPKDIDLRIDTPMRGDSPPPELTGACGDFVEAVPKRNESFLPFDSNCGEEQVQWEAPRTQPTLVTLVAQSHVTHALRIGSNTRRAGTPQRWTAPYVQSGRGFAWQILFVCCLDFKAPDDCPQHDQRHQACPLGPGVQLEVQWSSGVNNRRGSRQPIQGQRSCNMNRIHELNDQECKRRTNGKPTTKGTSACKETCRHMDCR